MSLSWLLLNVIDLPDISEIRFKLKPEESTIAESLDQQIPITS